MNNNNSDKIYIINTKEFINNDFWVCLFHDNPINTFNNSINKDVKIETLSEIKKIYSKDTLPAFLVSPEQKELIFSEYHLEKERQSHFQEYPSRCSSFYVFPTKEEMQKAINIYHWNPKYIMNVFINTAKPYKALKSNMELISSFRAGNPNQLPFSDYWNCKIYDIIYSNGKIYPPIIEIIIEGELLSKEIFIYNQ